jgi:hypothetical protein
LSVDHGRYRALLARAVVSYALDEETISAIEANAEESQQNDEPSDRRPLWVEVALLVREVRRLEHQLDERGFSE